MRRCYAAVLMVISLALVASRSHAADVSVGSKKFTESVVLGEVLKHMLTPALPDHEVTHRRELGGTRVVWGALESGDIDAYVEYTGTLREEIFAQEQLQEGDAGLEDALKKRGIGWVKPLGFNNTYAIGLRSDRAQELSISTISDLARHPDLKLRFGNEFMDRADGWPALRSAYGLPHKDVKGLDHDLAYRGLVAGDVDVMDCYSTDAEVQYYDLTTLEDDLAHFSRYDAVILFRLDLPSAGQAALERLRNGIDESAMIGMNAAAKIDKVPETVVAADFIEKTQSVAVVVEVETVWTRLWTNTQVHLFLVSVALFGGVLCAVPLGVIAARRRRLGQLVLAVVGVLQTVPSLALLVFMIPILGIGAAPAIAALFVYSLLPIVRNTVSGMTQIPHELIEVANVIGLSSKDRLTKIELPLASPSIVAGVKTSAVLCVGTATLGALIGAGGYGQPILTGIRLDDYGLILEGAVPAAVLAVMVQGLGEVISRWVVPRGLRLGEANEMRPAA